MGEDQHCNGKKLLDSTNDFVYLTLALHVGWTTKAGKCDATEQGRASPCCQGVALLPEMPMR